jgi:hypothetical protein
LVVVEPVLETEAARQMLAVEAVAGLCTQQMFYQLQQQHTLLLLAEAALVDQLPVGMVVLVTQDLLLRSLVDQYLCQPAAGQAVHTADLTGELAEHHRQTKEITRHRQLVSVVVVQERIQLAQRAALGTIWEQQLQPTGGRLVIMAAVAGVLAPALADLVVVEQGQ